VGTGAGDGPAGPSAPATGAAIEADDEDGSAAAARGWVVGDGVFPCVSVVSSAFPTRRTTLSAAVSSEETGGGASGGMAGWYSRGSWPVSTGASAGVASSTVGSSDGAASRASDGGGAVSSLEAISPSGCDAAVWEVGATGINPWVASVAADPGNGACAAKGATTTSGDEGS